MQGQFTVASGPEALGIGASLASGLHLLPSTSSSSSSSLFSIREGILAQAVGWGPAADADLV